jgi:RNA polymerase subunit RPABC4/transcription elongation factor Spt4
MVRINEPKHQLGYTVEYVCEPCKVSEIHLKIEIKKKCPRCGKLMIAEEWEG